MPAAEPAKAIPVRRPEHRFLKAALVVVVLAFLAGYEVGSRRSEEAIFEEGRRQLMEFLRVGEETSILQVDRRRMDEIIAGEGWATEDSRRSLLSPIPTNSGTCSYE